MRAELALPPKLVDVFVDKADEVIRYRGAEGGRGSGKTFSFAKMTAVFALKFAQAGVSGIILCGREFMNSLSDSSMAEIKAAIKSEPELLEPFFDIGEKYIRTKPFFAGRVDYVFAGLRHNLDSIKSKSRILILWVDEADPVTETAWVKIIPTVRAEGSEAIEVTATGEQGFTEYFNWNSEIWVTWNPERRGSATDKRFKQNPPNNSKIVTINYMDNPWFPDVLELERLDDLKTRQDQYEHIWEGDYRTVVDGAYFAPALAKAKRDNRIVEGLPEETLLKLHSFHDIGGAGARADAYTIWICQFVNGKVHVLDYYESVGQTLDYHVNWMREEGYERAVVWLPHDGVNTNNVTGKRYEDHWRDAGFKQVRSVANQGAGAAMQRVEAVRRIFNRCWFNASRTEQGRDALGWYHEKTDENRNIGLGPDHDWSSHGADSFGLMAIKYEALANANRGVASKDIKLPPTGA